MPTGKRASMREGPLAALFRKTAEDTGQPGSQPLRGRRASRPPSAREAHRIAPEPPAAPQALQPEPQAAPQAQTPPPPAPPEEEPERRIPSPQERLRHAFSADIPENVLGSSQGARAADGARRLRQAAGRRLDASPQARS